MPTSPTVFISYRQKSSGADARYINDRLQSMGLKVFFDADDIHAGDNWRASLETNLQASDYLLVVLAPDTLESEWVRREIEIALRHRKIIIPIFTNGLRNLYDVDFSQYPEQIAPLRDIQGIEYHYKKPQATFDALTEIFAVTPNKSARNNVESEPKKARIEPTVMVAIVTGIFAVMVAVIGIVPNLLPKATETLTLPVTTQVVVSSPSNTPSLPTDTTVPSTNTPIPPTSTDVPDTNTPVPLTATTAPTLTPVPPTASPTDVPPTPTIAPTQTLIPPSPMSASATPDAGQLHVYATRESLTLFVPNATSLSGFQFGVIINGSLKLLTLSDTFDSLKLTGGQTNPNDCYVYQVDGTTPPLSQSCKGQVFRTNLAAADVFWYDSVTQQPRDLAIFSASQSTGIICSATNPDCAVNWVPNFVPTSISIVTSTYTPVQPTLMPPSPTLRVNSFPCDATIVFTTGAMINQFKVAPQKNAPSQLIQQGAKISVLAKQRDIGLDWFQIRYDGNKGWILSEYVVLSSNCPTQ